jgi:hypothetical protein
MMAAPLKGMTVGISISNSPDLGELGLSKRHLDDAMTRVALHLLAAGARLIYGGDLREGGFTELLFEFIAMHYKPPAEERPPPVVNMFAWPVHTSMKRDVLSSKVTALESLGAVVFLGPKGTPIPKKRALMETQRNLAPEEWATGLTRMRKRLTSLCDARVLLGGRVEGYLGLMPGVAEEALLSLQAGKPTYLVGGFGGCVRDILSAMQLDIASLESRSADWKGCDVFQSFRARDLHDGLKLDECKRLATTKHIDEIVTLLLRGLTRRARAQGRRRRQRE